MLKHLYDTDCVTWSPQGKLFQVDYAMEAVKQGSICLGLKSKENVVICSLKRQPSELAGFQEKQFKIHDHIGIAIAGLTADARVLCKFMRNECLVHKFTYESFHPLNRLISKIAESTPIVYYLKNPSIRLNQPTNAPMELVYSQLELMQKRNNNINQQDGTHLYETCPSGNFYEYKCQAIGCRSQAARTYFESWAHLFENCDSDKLILHGLSAIKKAVMEDEEISNQNVEVGIVGADQKFRNLSIDELNIYIAKLNDFKPEDQMEIIQG